MERKIESRKRALFEKKMKSQQDHTADRCAPADVSVIERMLKRQAYG